MNHPYIVYYVEDINGVLYKIYIDTYELINNSNLVNFNEWILLEGRAYLEYAITEFTGDYYWVNITIHDWVIDNAEKILFSRDGVGQEYVSVYVLTNDGKLYVIGEFIGG